MTPISRSGNVSGAAWAATVAAIGIGLVVPMGAGAQMDSIRAEVEQRELDYQVAKDDYRAAYSRRGQLEREWSQLNNELDIARESQSNAEKSEMLAQLQELSGQVERADGWAESRKDVFVAAGTALVSALEGQLEMLAAQIAADPDTARGRELGDLYRDRSNRVREVETEVGERIELVLDPLPDIVVGPRDTPRQILSKARFLDDKAEQLERVIEDVDAEVDKLRRRLQRDRVTSDFFADPNRVGDTRLPVTSGTSGADAIGSIGPWSGEGLQEKIDALAAFRGAVESRREQLRQKAEQFRVLAGNGTP